MNTLQASALLANLLLTAGVLGAVLAAWGSTPLQGRMKHYVAKLDTLLCYLQLRYRGQHVLRAQLAAAGAAFALSALQASPAPLLLLPLLTVLPTALLQSKAARRTTRIEQQMDTWLLSLSNALRANPSLGEGIAASAQLMREPLASELDLVVKEHRLGTPLDRALQTMSRRVRSPVLSSAVVALRIARNAGGNLHRTLETTAAALREMARLEGVIRTKTAEGRAQSAVIAAVPAGIFWMLDSLDPELLAPLVDTSSGQLLLGVVGVLWLAALLLARRIVAVEV